MKTILLATATMLLFAGTAAANDIADMAMTPAQLMTACLDKAASAADATAQEADRAACHRVQDMLMGEAAAPVVTAPDAMAPNAMSGNAMAPAQ